jgi:uncharacterized protein YbjT (DUF2867 family)
MKILVSGGTGFVGRAVVREFLDAGHEIVILQRPGSKRAAQSGVRVQVLPINLEHPIMTGEISADAIVNLSGIIREFPSQGISFYKSHFLVNKHLIDLAVSKGIKRYLMMSALGVYSNHKTAYQETKYQAEQYLHDSGLSWTIFRPSLIFGPDGEFTQMLINMIRRLPLVPVVGNGKYLLQPVWIGDVVKGFLKALGDSQSFGMTYEFGGPDIFTYDQILDILGESIGRKRVRKLHFPAAILRPMASILGRFRFFPLTSDQITMLLDGNYTEDKTFFETFRISAKSFRDGLSEHLR